MEVKRRGKFVGLYRLFAPFSDNALFEADSVIQWQHNQAWNDKHETAELYRTGKSTWWGKSDKAWKNTPQKSAHRLKRTLSKKRTSFYELQHATLSLLLDCWFENKEQSFLPGDRWCSGISRCVSVTRLGLAEVAQLTGGSYALACGTKRTDNSASITHTDQARIRPWIM